MKRLLTVCLALAMVLSLCACGKKLTPEEVLEQVAENMEDLESSGFSMDMKMKMDVPGLPIDIRFSMEGEMILEKPQLVHAKGECSLPIVGEVPMEIYTQDDGEECVTYTCTEVMGEKQWTKESAPTSMNPALNAMETIDLIKNLEESEETKKIHGVEATRYDGVIKGKDIKKLLESMGSMNDMMGSMGDMDEAMELIDGIKIPVTYYVDTEEMMLVSTEVDMTDMMEEIMKQSADEEELEQIKIKDFSMKMSFFDYDDVDKIEIPQEALDAAEEDVIYSDDDFMME